MREIVFDTETTGLDPQGGDRLAEIGCIEMVNRVETGRTFHSYFNPERSMPAAAKAGVMALTRCAAIEAGPRGVRINAVSPSIAMHANLAKVTSDDLLAELTQREAFGRFAEPWEIANVIVFLASDYSSYMTGEVLSVSSQRA